MNNFILIVEDSQYLASFLAKSLRIEFKMPTLTASTLARAQEIMSQSVGSISCAVVDINLPDAPRGEAVAAVLSHGIATIALTGSCDPVTRDAILNLDILAFILKGGHTLSRIISTIRKHNRCNRVNVMVVDDDPIAQTMLKKLLENHGYQVFVAANGIQALEQMKLNKGIKLVITDYQMPEMDGLDLVSAIRQHHGMDQVAIIGLSALDTDEITVHFLKVGANDFLYKNFSTEEFNCRVRQNVDMLDHISEIRESANRDALTQLYNRGYFFKAGSSLLEVCRRTHTPFAIAMLDIDHFKAINDIHGHAVGDIVLREIGLLLRRNSRNSDILARYGGEEFCLFASNILETDVPEYLNNICSRIAALRIAHDKGNVSITISIGSVSNPNLSLLKALQIADTRLYQAKQLGRNRVVHEEPKPDNS